MESPRTLTSATDEQEVRLHTGSIQWSEYRKRWVALFVQSGGKSSYLGDLWYAEARSPLGPWGKAVPILSHDRYTFYNPRLHPELVPADKPYLLFEGTYTMTLRRAFRQPATSIIRYSTGWIWMSKAKNRPLSINSFPCG